MVLSVFAGVTLFSSWFIEKDINITGIFDFLEFFVFWFSRIHISINFELEQGFFFDKSSSSRNTKDFIYYLSCITIFINVLFHLFYSPLEGIRYHPVFQNELAIFLILSAMSDVRERREHYQNSYQGNFDIWL